MAQRVHGVLTANTKATATVTAAADRMRAARTIDVNVEVVRVVNHGPAGVIYFTTSGTDPTVRGVDTHAVAPGGFVEIDVASVESQDVELISSGTPEYTVEVA